MRTAFAVLLMIAAGAALDGAKADPYRWCADYAGFRGLGATNCWFLTLAQCRAAVSGVGGYCKPNPFYDGLPLGSPPQARSKKRPS
jgi:hypothetical protein